MSNLTPIRVTGTFTPSGTQDVNIVSPLPLPISAASLPLPTGAATEATLLAAKIDLDKFTFLTSRLLVDGSGVIQPVSGTVAVSNFPATQSVTQGTSPWVVDGSGFVQPVSGPLTDTQLRASPVPVTGTITTSPDVNVHDGTGVSISSTGSSLNVNVTNTVPVSGTVAVTQSTSPWVISGTVTANAGTNLNTSLLATEATLLAAKLDLDKFTFIATRLLVDGSGVTQPISGTVTANQGTSPWVISGSVTANAGTNLNTSALLLDTTFTSRINTLGQKTMANSTPVVIASDQSAITVTGSLTPGTSTTAAVTRVATANTSHQLIASNASRKALTFYNDSTSQQFIKFGTTASQTDFTVRMSTQDYYEVPQPVYSGRIDVLGTNNNGAIQVTEMT